jgi:hypothetical protein
MLSGIMLNVVMLSVVAPAQVTYNIKIREVLLMGKAQYS